MGVSKLVLIGSGVGISATTAGGVAFYLTSGETIVNYISKLKSSKNKKFIALVSDANSHLQKRYSSSKELNKPTKNSKEIEDIVKWCKDWENIKFSSESDTNYKLIASWCFVNINSLLKEAQSKGKNYFSSEGKEHEDWKKAWDAYNQSKVLSKLEINNITDLNSERGKGGPALHEWCKAQDNKKMYEENSEETYKRYEKWCFKDQ